MDCHWGDDVRDGPMQIGLREMEMNESVQCIPLACCLCVSVVWAQLIVKGTIQTPMNCQVNYSGIKKDGHYATMYQQ